MKNSFYIAETSSTNETLWQKSRQQELPEGFAIYTDFQTSGKGQTGNSWFSGKKKNILCSLLLYPGHIRIAEHFILSQLVSVAVKKTLDEYVDNISIKWPNDIYWKDQKIVGMLIENSIQGAEIRQSVIGIGININQKQFPAELINPVSLYQITGKTQARKPILEKLQKNILHIYRHWDTERIKTSYMNMLYRNQGFHPFKENETIFEARIHAIHSDGCLELELRNGGRKKFYFKEVQYVQ